MLIEIDSEIRLALLKLLHRVDLKGAEVPVFNKIVKALSEEYKGDKKNDSGKEGE